MKTVPDNVSPDPYSPPELRSVPTQATLRKKKSTAVTAIGVITLVLGILGLIQGLFGVISLAGGSNTLTSANPTSDPALYQAYQNFEEDVTEIQNKYFAISVPLLCIQLPLMIALVVVGVYLAQKSPRYRIPAIRTLAVALIFELIRAVPTFLMQYDNLQAANRFVNEIGGINGAGSASMRMLTQVSITSGVVIFFILFIARAAFFVWAIRYLQRASTSIWFADEGGEIVVAQISG